jgi:hypothetical protein
MDVGYKIIGFGMGLLRPLDEAADLLTTPVSCGWVRHVVRQRRSFGSCRMLLCQPVYQIIRQH